MTLPFARRVAPLALAALLTGAMLLATNALAAHQFRVAAAPPPAPVLALDVQHVTVAGHRRHRA
jgi:hypothetical protein